MKPEAVRSSDRLGTMPEGQLLFRMALPMILAMLVQALYNIVDSIYVAQISENALTAVSLAYPMQTLMIAVSTGLGVGINSTVSRSLGERDGARAGRLALHGLLLILASAAVFTAIGLTGARAFMDTQTDIAEIVEGGTAYVSICMGLCVFQFVEITFERFLQATGRTVHSMISQGVGAVVNIVFDPILIFGWLGFPAMGVAGAAAATVFGQAVACVLAIVFHVRGNRELRLPLRGFRPQRRAFRQILSIGVPSILIQAIGSLMSYGMNRILLGFVSTAAAVFGVYYKLQSIIFMPVFGLNNGMVPIVAYNYGARKKSRIVRTVRLSCVTAVAMMAAGLLLMQLLPETLLLLFDAQEQMLRVGVPAMRIMSLCFLPAGFCIVISSVFQALGNGVYSMITSFLRQVVVLLPVAYLLSLAGRVELVWWAFPIAEVASLVFTLLFLRRINRRVLQPLEG